MSTLMRRKIVLMSFVVVHIPLLALILAWAAGVAQVGAGNVIISLFSTIVIACLLLPYLWVVLRTADQVVDNGSVRA